MCFSPKRFVLSSLLVFGKFVFSKESLYFLSFYWPEKSLINTMLNEIIIDHVLESWPSPLLASMKSPSKNKSFIQDQL